MMKCTQCSNKNHLIKIKLKGLDQNLEAYVCPRCFNVQLKLKENAKKPLIKSQASKDLKKAKKIK